MAIFQDNLDKPAPEFYSGFYWS